MTETLSKKDFLQNARKGQHNLFFLSLPIADGEFTPTQILSFFDKQAEYAFLLESDISSFQEGRYTFVGMQTVMQLCYRDNSLHIKEINKQDRSFSVKDPFPLIRKTFKFFHLFPLHPSHSHLSFIGSGVGYVSYDSIRMKEDIPQTVHDDLNIPDLFFIVPRMFLVFDYQKKQTTAFFSIYLNGSRSEEHLSFVYDQAVDNLTSIIDDILKNVTDIKESSVILPEEKVFPYSLKDCEDLSIVTKKDYKKNVNIAKKYIREGDIFQVVLSQRFDIPVKSHPLDIYRVLRCLNPSPYMFYLKCGTFVLTGSSPERMLSLKNGSIFTKPIAGTVPRGKTPEEDEEMEQKLINDPKECSEHLMLVDLGRNDIGRIAEPHSVRVKNLMTLERYSHVIHIVSEVEGILSKSKDYFDAMFALFPAGTLSGAPKIRAMEIIDELESTKRSTYGGLAGYFSFNGDADTCIVIRSMIYQNNKVFIQSGAGIVADSDPEKEYNECLNKAFAVIKAVKIAESQTKK